MWQQYVTLGFVILGAGASVCAFIAAGHAAAGVDALIASINAKAAKASKGDTW